MEKCKELPVMWYEDGAWWREPEEDLGEDERYDVKVMDGTHFDCPACRIGQFNVERVYEDEDMWTAQCSYCRHQPHYPDDVIDPYIAEVEASASEDNDDDSYEAYRDYYLS